MKCDSKMTMANSLIAMTKVADYLERNGAKIIAASIDNVCGMDLQLAKPVPELVSKRVQKMVLTDNGSVKHSYTTDDGIVIFWLT